MGILWDDTRTISGPPYSADERGGARKTAMAANDGGATKKNTYSLRELSSQVTRGNAP
jgi:hypothetical protein